MESASANRSTDGAAGWPDRRRTRRYVLLAALVAGALAFAWLVWPTPYRYGRDTDRHRVNRFTGKAQVYDQRKEEWRPSRRSGGGNSSNGSGTQGGGSGGGSPIGGSRSGGGGRDRGDEWWHEEAPPKERKKAKGDQWWYQDGKKAPRNPDASPIGGSRKPAPKGSPIGGQ